MKNDPALIDEMLRTARTIAVVGMSDKTWRASHNIGKYLSENGYRVLPVNPALSEVMGLECYASLDAAQAAAIAQTGKGRLPTLSDIPPMSDTLPGFEGYEWNGVFVPHGTPAGIVTKLNAGLNAALVSPQVSTRFAELNVESRQNTPQEFGAFVERQTQMWSRIVKEANIKLG